MHSYQSNRRQFLHAAASAAGLSTVSARRVLGANDRLGIAVIGCGQRNLLGEVLQYAEATNSAVVAVCDTWRQRREEAAAAVRKASGADVVQLVHYQDVLARRDVDAVVVGSPDHQHCTMLIDACRAGKDAYVEKPLAMDMKELHRAVAAVKTSERIVQMGTQIRSYGNVAAARRFVGAGGLGKIFKIEQSRNAYRPYWHRYAERPVTEADVDWRAFLMHRRYRPFDADQYAGWYGYREFSRGPHAGLMVHFIDLVHHITGAGIPRRVVTMGGTYRWKDARTAPDSVETVLEYPDEGFLVRYSTAFGTGANNYMKFFGQRGVLDTSRWNRPFSVSGEGSEDPEKLGEPAPLADLETTPHMKNWLECVRQRRQPAAPIEAGYAHSVAVIMSDEAMIRGCRMIYDAASRSIRQG